MSTGVDVFDTTLQKTINLLNDISGEFGWPEERRHQSYSALRSVLHALRDRLVVAEAANFAAQLTMLVRGLYYEGWKPEAVPKKMHREEFLAEIQKQFQYSVEGGPERLVNGVLSALSKHIEPRTLEHIKKEMPSDIAELFQPAA
jgi:uncharacterized protein (DUF2267 family)